MEMDLRLLQELPERYEGVRVEEGDEVPITEVVRIANNPHQDEHDHMENQELPGHTRGQEGLPLRGRSPVRFDRDAGACQPCEKAHHRSGRGALLSRRAGGGHFLSPRLRRSNTSSVASGLATARTWCAGAAASATAYSSRSLVTRPSHI